MIKLAWQRPAGIGKFRDMPTTHDLSQGQSALLYRWLAGAHRGGAGPGA